MKCNYLGFTNAFGTTGQDTTVYNEPNRCIAAPGIPETTNYHRSKHYVTKNLQNVSDLKQVPPKSSQPDKDNREDLSEDRANNNSYRTQE